MADPGVRRYPRTVSGGSVKGLSGRLLIVVPVEPIQPDLTTAPNEPVAAVEVGRARAVRVFDRVVPSRLRFLVLLALVMCVVTAFVTEIENLPFRDPDDALGPSWVRLPLILLLAILLDVVPRMVLRWRKGVTGLTAVRQVLFERWPRSQIQFSLIGLASWYLTYAAFRNLKNAVPFVNDRLWDRKFASYDHLMFLGHYPGAVLHDVLGTSWAASFFAVIYVLWIGLIPASLAWALAWTRNHAVAAWYITALGLDWALGVTAYYLFPTLGPIYTRSGDFASLPHSATTLQTTMMDDRTSVLLNPHSVDTLQTIAAFPSLHVGMMVTLCLLVHWNTHNRILRALAWLMLVLTVLATLYLGWHFFVDVIGGAAVGALAAWLGGKVVGAKRSADPLPVGTSRGE
jgi:membrane-associated phospholipid phosphatase